MLFTCSVGGIFCVWVVASQVQNDIWLTTAMPNVFFSVQAPCAQLTFFVVEKYIRGGTNHFQAEHDVKWKALFLP